MIFVTVYTKYFLEATQKDVATVSPAVHSDLWKVDFSASIECLRIRAQLSLRIKIMDRTQGDMSP